MSYDPAARRQTPLAQRLKQRLATAGAMPVSDFMAACLWDPDYGYYATREGIGGAGDFITAAEISQTFGELLGLWAGIVWQQTLGTPPRLTLAEFGPGRGTMMRDIWRAARVVPGFREAAAVHLIEASPTLERLQRETLAQDGVPAAWGNSMTGFAAPALILANEFLDAWPVDQWVKSADGWCHRGVTLDARGELEFCLMAQAAGDDALQRLYPNAPLGSIVESQRPERFAQALRTLAAGGPIVALLIDYGYASASEGDTLQAVRAHAHEHVLTSPGEADLSCHVNFNELAHALHTAGFEIDGPTTQAEFLGALGIIERAARLMHANPHRAGEIEAGVARLIAPQGMGTRFKVIGVRSPGLPPLPGFTVTPPTSTARGPNAAP